VRYYICVLVCRETILLTFYYLRSALPIVDRAQEMQLVGVVTLKDIKTALEDFKQLFVPIEDYVAQIRQKNVGTLREYPFISMVSFFKTLCLFSFFFFFPPYRC